MSKRPIHIYTAIAIAAFCMFAFSAYANVHAQLQAAIFVKLLNYDTGLASKKQRKIKFHIVTDSKTASKAGSLKSAFASMAKQKIAGKTVTVVTTSVGSLSGALSASTAHIIYLPAGTTSSTLNTATSLGKSKKVAVLAGDAKLAKSGAAVGITVENKKPKIIVNLKQSKAFGMNLSSQLLKLAKVI